MSKALCSALALCAALVCLPASAATIATFTLDRDTIQGGEPAFAQVSLDTPAPAGGAAVQVFSLSRSVLPGGAQSSTSMTIPAGQTVVAFDMQTLPVDTPISTYVGVSFGA